MSLLEYELRGGLFGCDEVTVQVWLVVRRALERYTDSAEAQPLKHSMLSGIPLKSNVPTLSKGISF